MTRTADALCTELCTLGVEAMAIQANVADAASGVLKPALEMSTKHWRWCLETNALALNPLVQKAYPMMKPGIKASDT